MDSMARTPEHAKSRDDSNPQAHARGAAWIVLVGAGATTMSFNIWHAVHTGMPLGLALLYGTAPVALAMGLSHIVAAHEGGWFMKGTTFAVMIGAMVLSVSATGDVVHSSTGRLWWLFGAVVDAAALVALQVILSPASRAAAKAAKKATPDAAAEAMNSAAASAIPGPSGEPGTGPLQEPPAGPYEMPSPKPSAGPPSKAVRISKDPEAEKARAAYRKSVRAGQPLSDRALGEMFGKSRTWGGSRIREVDAGPQLTARAQ